MENVKVYAISKQPSDRLFDIIVYGATGYTGKEISKYICKTAHAGLKWAIAGRSQAKLGSLKSHLLSTNAGGNLPDVLVSDVDDTRTLQAMFAETRLVLNCTGPYRFLGKQVVEACLVVKADYMDICGEPQFMESCFLDFHSAAVERNVVIVHACAFDSVPADLGCLYTLRQFPPECCTTIESFLHINCPKGLKAHYTTFESAVHGVADAATLKDIRKKIDAKYQPPAPIHVGAKLSRNSAAYFDGRVKKYAIPFMGADASVVRSSQRTMSLRTGSAPVPQYAAYACLNSMYWVATAGFFGTIFQTLASFEMGRNILLSCPEAMSNGVFSKEGPSKAQLEQTSFEMHFYAQGYSGETAASAPGHSSTTGTAAGKDEDEVGGEGGELTDAADAPESPAAGGGTSATSNPTRRGKEIIPTSELAETSTLSRSCDFSLTRTPSSSSTANSRAADKRVHAVVTGPEPGYVATPAIFVTLALSLLEQRSLMPMGGVLTPASAWAGVPDVFERLTAAGIGFRVVGNNWDDGIKKSSNVDSLDVDPLDDDRDSLGGGDGEGEGDGEGGSGERGEKAGAAGARSSSDTPAVEARPLARSGGIYIEDQEAEKK